MEKVNLLISLAMVALVAVLVTGLWQMWRLTKIGHALAETTKPYQHLQPAASYKILVLGDSTAVGTGSARPEDSVAGRFGTDAPTAQLTNLGRNGYKLKNLSDQLATLPPQQYDLVVLQIGSNDIMHFTSLAQVAEELDPILAWAKNHSPQVVVLHSGDVGSAPFFPWWLKPLLKHRSLQVRAIFQRLTEAHHIVYVDLYGEGADGILLSNVGRYYSADLLHPSGEGYGVWYQYLRKAMTQTGIILPKQVT